MKHPLLIIAGPTATGKTDLGIILAKKFNGELIACDSRQVYKGLDLGTGKYPANFKSVTKHKRYWVVDGILIHGYDLVSPSEVFDTMQYLSFAKTAVTDIQSRSKLPIIVGGTGLYLKTLLEGIEASGSLDPKLRQELESLKVEELISKLKVLNNQALVSMNESDSKNPRRLIRAIEKALDKNKPKKISGIGEDFMMLKIMLTAPLQYLYQKTDRRVEKRIKQGMIEEVKKLNQKGLTLTRMRELGLEYGVLADYLSGLITAPVELENVLKLKIRHFVKRQLTWFKREKEGLWVDISKDYIDQVEKLVAKWYDTNA